MRMSPEQKEALASARKAFRELVQAHPNTPAADIANSPEAASIHDALRESGFSLPQISWHVNSMVTGNISLKEGRGGKSVRDDSEDPILSGNLRRYYKPAGRIRVRGGNVH